MEGYTVSADWQGGPRLSVYFEEPLCGTIFKVKQQNENKNPPRDFYHSVDRRFIATRFKKEFVGIDVISELRCDVPSRQS